MKNWLMKNFRPFLFYCVLFLFILILSSTVSNYDFDLWARLIAGMSVVQSGVVLKQDFLSYTPTHTWYDHEWGSGVLFYIVQHFFSAPGILFLQAGLMFLIFFVVSRVVKLRGTASTQPYNLLFYYFLFMALTEIALSPVRCQLFSFLFFTIFIYILELSRKGTQKSLFLLPFLMIIWNNLHGGCVSGLGLIGIYLVGEFLNKKPFKQYLYLLLACVAVLPLNPWGVDYLKFLFSAATMPRPHIIEWWGLFSSHNVHNFFRFKFYILFMLFFQGIFIFRAIKDKTFVFDKTKYILLLTTLFLAIKHVKMAPFFLISLSCMTYDDFYSAFNFLTRGVFNRIALVKDSIVYFLFILFICINLCPRTFEPLVTFDAYPYKSVEFLKINKISGKLIVNFGLGSYVSYKLYPQNKIYMDGRYEEVYDDELLEDLKRLYFPKKRWDETLIKYPPDVIIMEKYYNVYKVLKSQKEWTLVYDKDPLFGVFVKTKNVKKKYLQPSEDINYYKKAIFDTDINFMLQSKNEQK